MFVHYVRMIHIHPVYNSVRFFRKETLLDHPPTGDHAFAEASPRAWNNVPQALRLTTKPFSTFIEEILSFLHGL